MESGILPSATMLLHTNDFHQQISSSDSPMNQYSDVYSSRQSVQTNNKTNKRKLDEFADPSSTEFDSSFSSKPQKTEQIDSERSLSRTGTRKKFGKSSSIYSLFFFSFQLYLMVHYLLQHHLEMVMIPVQHHTNSLHRLLITIERHKIHHYSQDKHHLHLHRICQCLHEINLQ